MNNWFFLGLSEESESSLTLEWLAHVIEARPPGWEVARQLPRKGRPGGPGALPASSDCYRGINSMIAQCGRGRGSKTAASQGACFLPGSATGAPRAPLLRAGNADKATMLSAVIRTGEEKKIRPLRTRQQWASSTCLCFIGSLRLSTQAGKFQHWRVGEILERNLHPEWPCFLFHVWLDDAACLQASHPAITTREVLLRPEFHGNPKFLPCWSSFISCWPFLFIFLHKALQVSMFNHLK